MLRSVEDQITVYTDLKNLEYINTTKILNRRQHRWAQFLQSFNFKVVYSERRLNDKADALSRRRDYRPEGGSNSDPYTFFRPHQYVGQERDILRPQVLLSCPGFRPQSPFRTALVTTLQIGSYSGLDSSPYGIPSGNHIEDRPVYLVYYR